MSLTFPGEILSNKVEILPQIYALLFKEFELRNKLFQIIGTCLLLLKIHNLEVFYFLDIPIIVD